MSDFSFKKPWERRSDGESRPMRRKPWEDGERKPRFGDRKPGTRGQSQNDAETAEADAATAKEVVEPPADVADPQPASLVQDLII